MTSTAQIVRYLYSIGFREVRAFGEVYYLRGYEAYSLKYLKCFMNVEEFVEHGMKHSNTNVCTEIK